MFFEVRGQVSSARCQKGKLWLLAFSFWFVASGFLPLTAHPTKSSVLIAKSSSCQEQDIETLTAQLLKDLPSYANRTSQRVRRRSRTANIYSYVLLAGRPEFAP